MKTAKDWIQIHGENAFYANGVLSEADIELIQRDAAQATVEAILQRIAAGGIDVTDCDGDDDPAIILADWTVGQIRNLTESLDKTEDRLRRFQEQF